MTCPKCGNQMQIQAVSEVKRRGFFTVLLYLILICIPIIGWIILISLVRGQKSQTKTVAVCQTCGYQYEYSQNKSGENNNPVDSLADALTILAIVVAAAGLYIVLKVSWWGYALVAAALALMFWMLGW